MGAGAAAAYEAPKPAADPQAVPPSVTQLEDRRAELQRLQAQMSGDAPDSTHTRLEAARRQLQELEQGILVPESERIDSTEVAAARAELERLRQSSDLSERGRQREEEELRRLQRESDTTARQLQDMRIAADRSRKGLDLCILMDCTFSMDPWIEEAARHIARIFDEVQKIDRDYQTTRIAFVGYRDYMDAQRFEIVDFVDRNELDRVRRHIQSIEAIGGGDTPEDLSAALARVEELSWLSTTKVLIHVTDAPCHGVKYHDVDDDRPEGDPDHNPEEILDRFAKRRIDYYFLRLDPRTDKMTDIFRRVYQRYYGVKFSVLNTNSQPSEFLPSVIASLSSSIAR